MGHRPVHLMQAVLDEAREVMRYTCSVCSRCIEDGPDGLRVVKKGDLEAVHRGGSLAPAMLDLESEPQPPPLLH